MVGKDLKRRARSVENTWLTRTGYDRDTLKRRKHNKNKQKFKRNKRFNFYKSNRWCRLRAKAFQLYGAVCMKCHAVRAEADMQVDHIKPRSKYPSLQYNLDNLQILCQPCNQEKSNLNCNDYREVKISAVDRYFGLKDNEPT